MQPLESDHLFWKSIHAACDPTFLLETRIHTLLSLYHEGAEVWIKREDEHGFGVSGPKKRKYASLLPYLESRAYDLVGLIGGPNSNHLVGLAQLLNERRIPWHLYVKEKKGALQGNQWLLDLLTAPEARTFLPDLPWSDVHAWAAKQLQHKAAHSWLVPEGGTSAAALPGLLTLGLEIRQWESEQGWAFDHIWVDAGTGGTAAALAHSLALLGHAAQLHIVLAAGSDADFQLCLTQTRQWLEDLKIPPDAPLPLPPKLYRPFTAKAFGSVNAGVRELVRTLARTEGLLCDPVYTAKLIGTLQSTIQAGKLKGRILLIHGGGGTGLMGFAGNL